MRKLNCFMMYATLLMVFFTVGQECRAEDQSGGHLAQWRQSPCVQPQQSLDHSQASPAREAAQTPAECPQSRSLATAINGFFAFGCRINYQLLNWILSDKCEIGQRTLQ